MFRNPPAELWITRRTLRAERIGVAVMAGVFLFATVANIAGYRIAYPTAAERLHVFAQIGGNAAVRLFYGYPFDLSAVGGYVAWRIGGILSVVAAAWGLFVALNALRGEEDAGRWELVLAGAVSRRRAPLAALAAIMLNVCIIWLATALGALIAGWTQGDMPFGECFYFGLAVAISAAVFAALGGLVTQLMPTLRQARLAGISLLIGALLLRTAADTQSGAGWARWLSPLGWVEELRAFTGAQYAVLLLPIGATAVLAGAAAMLAARRDVGTGLVAPVRQRRSSDWLLGSPTTAALRMELQTLALWLVGAALYAFIIGSLAETAAELVRKTPNLHNLGNVPLTSAEGYLAYVFLFFVLAACLLAGTQLTAAREEEGSGRLEALLAQPVSRYHWLGGRLALALLAATTLALVAGLLSWLGAAAQHAPVHLTSMLGAAANCLPITLFFLGLTALVFGFAPRLTAGFLYLSVGVSFLWALFGPLLKAPGWVLDLSPFHHVAAVPVQPFDGTWAAIMAAIGIAGLAAGMWRFRQRDLAAA